jgi:hypothetical protein
MSKLKVGKSIPVRVAQTDDDYTTPEDEGVSPAYERALDEAVKSALNHK